MLLALGGICGSLSLICLFLSGAISINTFAFLALSSVFTGVMYIEGGLKYSLLIYFAVSLASFLLPVDKLNFLYYLCFFGYYPIVKGIIEKFKKLSLEIIVKTVFFAVVSFSGVFLMLRLAGASFGSKLPWQIISLIGIFAFHIYDYCLSIFFDFYEKRIRNKIKR